MINWIKSKTIGFGALLAIVPHILSFFESYDVTRWGLSPSTATVIGAAVIFLRTLTTQPLSQK